MYDATLILKGRLLETKISSENYYREIDELREELGLKRRLLAKLDSDGFNSNDFYYYYERLQLAKEFSDLTYKKEINGAGEGISIQVSGKLSNTNVERDMELYELIKDKMVSISRRHTRPELWPNWMK